MHIEVKNLVKTFKKRNVVDGVSLRVDKGEIVGLLGATGAGNTTTSYMIVGLETPTSGEVLISDIPIADMPMHKRARLGISYLAQEASIFRGLTVEQNIMSILDTLPLTQAEKDNKIDSLLEEFHVAHVRERLGSELSGGERRRVEIARCLVLEPKFILLDEPFAGVDPIAVADIQNIIGYLRDRGIGILITDHNVVETLRIVDRAYILNEGKILVEGDVDTILNDPLARRYYIGENTKL